MQTLKERIQSFVELQEGWNEEGEEIIQEVINKALKFLDDMQGIFDGSELDAFPCMDGSICISDIERDNEGNAYLITSYGIYSYKFTICQEKADDEGFWMTTDMRSNLTWEGIVRAMQDYGWVGTEIFEEEEKNGAISEQVDGV